MISLYFTIKKQAFVSQTTITFNDIIRKSCGLGLITKKHIVMHTHLNFNFKLVLYHTVQNCGREKLWRISDAKVLARKTSTNTQYLYYGKRKTLANHLSLTHYNSCVQ